MGKYALKIPEFHSKPEKLIKNWKNYYNLFKLNSKQFIIIIFDKIIMHNNEDSIKYRVSGQEIVS